MYDNDLSDSPELRELRDAVFGVATSGPPSVEPIIARGRARRRRRLTTITGLSVGGVVAATVLALGVSGAFTPSAKLGTIRTAAYTLRQNANGTDTLSLSTLSLSTLSFSMFKLLDPAQLQSDLAQYGIPAKVTTGSYCTSDPEPTGFAQAITMPKVTDPITIDPSKIPSGTELSIGYFQLGPGDGAPGGWQQADMSLINTDSFSCSTTPPDEATMLARGNGEIDLISGAPSSSG